MNYVGSFRVFSSKYYSYSNDNNQDKLININKGESLVNKGKNILDTDKLYFSEGDKSIEVNMKNELDKLKEKVDRLNSLRREFFLLRSECHKLAEDFLSRYSKFKPELENFYSYLDKTVDKFTLIKLL